MLLSYLWVANGKKAEQVATGIISWITGSTPTVVLLMVLYYIVFNKYNITNVAAAIVGFTIVFGCSFYEKILSGVKAVGPGYESDVIALIQDTSVVGYIAVLDLTKMSDLIRGRTYEAFFPLIATAVIYYILIVIVTALLSRLFFLIDNRNRKDDRVLKNITP